MSPGRGAVQARRIVAFNETCVAFHAMGVALNETLVAFNETLVAFNATGIAFNETFVGFNAMGLAPAKGGAFGRFFCVFANASAFPRAEAP